MLRIAIALLISLTVVSFVSAKECDERFEKLLTEERLEDSVDELFIAQHDEVYARRRCVRLQFEQLSGQQKLHHRRLLKALGDCRSEVCRRGVQEALKKLQARTEEAQKQYAAADAAVQKGQPAPQPNVATPVTTVVVNNNNNNNANRANNNNVAAPAVVTRGVITRDSASAAGGTVAVSTQPAPGALSRVREPLFFPLDQPLSYYKERCRQDPTNGLACSIGQRTMEIKDVNALEMAKSLGITINVPQQNKTKKGDYEVVIEDFTKDSPIVQQLKNGFKRAMQQREERQAAEQAAAVQRQLQQIQQQQQQLQNSTDPEAQARLQQLQAEQERLRQQELERQRQLQQQQQNTPRLTCRQTPAGRAITHPDGFTLYKLGSAPNDINGCDTASGCAPHWPQPSGPVAAGDGVTCTVSSTVRPDNGVQQWTCGGVVLYKSDRDTGPGQTRGHNFNGFFIANC